MLAGQRAEGYGPRAIGVLVRGSRELGRVSIAGAVICGYDEALAVDGASLQVTNSLICLSRKGAVLYSGDLSIENSLVGAEDVGVAAGQGRATADASGAAMTGSRPRATDGNAPTTTTPRATSGTAASV